jgi:hypothetical protein
MAGAKDSASMKATNAKMMCPDFPQPINSPRWNRFPRGGSILALLLMRSPGDGTRQQFPSQKPNQSHSHMKNFISFQALAILVWCQMAISASAAIVTYEFSGTVGYTSNPSNALPTGIVYGAPFTGIFTYNTDPKVSGPDMSASTNSGDFYFGTNGGFLMTVSVAGHTFSVTKHSAGDPTASFNVENDYFGEDSIQVGDSTPNVLMDGAQFPGNQVKCYASLAFYDYTATALDTDALPTNAPILAKFPNTHKLEINAYGPGLLFDFSGTITNISVVPHPPLSIRRGAGNNVVLAWPLAAQGFTLEQNTNLTGGGSWTTNATFVVDSSTEHSVTVPSSSAACFFRLISP